jgi:hypothetical protein
VAYINTSGRPSRHKRSECQDSDVHGTGIYWPIDVIKFAGGTIRLWGCGGNAPAVWYWGILGIPYESIQVCTVPYEIRMRRVLGVLLYIYIYIYIYIYLIDVNLYNY